MNKKSLTRRCFEEIENGGGTMREIASRIGEDELMVRKRISDLARCTPPKIGRQRVPCARRVYFYFPLDVDPPKPNRGQNKTGSGVIAGHIYFGQMKW